MKKAPVFLLCMLVAGGFFFLGYAPTNEYVEQYYAVLLSYFFVGLIIVIFYSKIEFDVFSPAFWVIIPTFFTFSVGPMTSVILKDTTIEGFEVFDGCYSGTIVYVLSILVFMLIYYGTCQNYDVEKTKIKKIVEVYESETISKQTLVTICIAFVILGVAVSYYSLLKRGLSLKYILSLGTNDSSTGDLESIGGLIDVIFFMYIPLLLLDRYMDNKILLTTIRVFAVIPLIVRGNRFFILMYVIPIVIMYYMNRNKRPTFLTGVVALLVFIGLMSGTQYIRSSLRMGDAFNEAWRGEYNLLYIWNSIQINLDMYKTLYGACMHFPSGHMYTFGIPMILGTIAQILPKQIRPFDLINVVVNERQYFMGPNSGSWTYAQLTEYYIEFGVLACMFFMGIFARFCKKIQALVWDRERDYLTCVLYAQMIPMIFQLVIRGQLPSNFWIIVFMMVPYWVIRRIKFRRV